MPSSRRRFLSGAAAGVALLAGCSDRSSNDPRGTVTPVEVPMTDSEILQQAASIEVPTLPPAVVVTDAHLRAAIGHVESLVEALEGELEEPEDVDFSGLRRPVPIRGDDTDGAAHVLQETRERLDAIREREPSLEALSDVQRTLRDVSLLLGFVRAEHGEVTLEEMRGTVDAELASVRTLRRNIEYRLASPVAWSLPTLRAAEEKLDSARRLRYALEAAEGAETEEPTSTRVAELRRQLARHRRRRRDAERFLATATDEDATSRRGSIDRELRAVQDELDALPERFQPRDDRRDPSTLAGEIRTNRRHVGTRASGWLDDFEAYREDGKRMLGLFRGQRILVEAAAVDAAVMRTTDRLDGRAFPAEAVPEEKRRAVDILEEVVDGTATQRAFASRAGAILDVARYGRGDDGVTVEEVARTFFLYAVAAGWAASGAERGRTMVESLQG